MRIAVASKKLPETLAGATGSWIDVSCQHGNGRTKQRQPEWQSSRFPLTCQVRPSPIFKRIMEMEKSQSTISDIDDKIQHLERLIKMLNKRIWELERAS